MKTFSKANLQGKVNVKVEAGSMMQHTKAIEEQTIKDAIDSGLVNTQSPRVRYNILDRVGLADLADDADDDIRDAALERKDFLESVQANPENPEKWITRPRKGIDNEQIHMLDAAEFAKSDEFFDLPPDARMMWEEHVGLHSLNIAQQMAMVQEPEPPKKASRKEPRI
jgi:hypothetical protein